MTSHGAAGRLWSQIFKKNLNKFHESPPIGSRVVPSGQTDGHDEFNSRFSLFATAPKTVNDFTYRFVWLESWCLLLREEICWVF